MILMDFSQLFIATAIQYVKSTGEELELPLLRHMAINTVLNSKEKLSAYADEIVLCIDSKDSWRKKIFPNYKKHRDAAKSKSDTDWSLLYECMDILVEEFKANLPYKVVDSENCEADDIIAVLTQRFAPHKKIVVSSSDHDFLQLRNLGTNIRQYSPWHKKFITDAEYDLFEHIVKGDPGDGIPNIFSDDDTFLEGGKKQKPIFKAKLTEWRDLGGINKPQLFCKTEEDLRKFERNQTLVDFNYIPEEYRQAIVTAYESAPINTGKLFNYLVLNKLKKILERGNF